MTGRERVVLRRISLAARGASDSLPANPADVARAAAAGRLMAAVLRDIAFALGTMADGQGDVSDVAALERRVAARDAAL